MYKELAMCKTHSNFLTILFFLSNITMSKLNSSIEIRIQAAICASKTQSARNISALARQYRVCCTTGSDNAHRELLVSLTGYLLIAGLIQRRNQLYAPILTISI